MKLKRLTLCAALAAGCLMLSAARPALADVLTPNLNQAEANRLSIFHDYSLDAVGNSGEMVSPSGEGVIWPWVQRLHGNAEDAKPQAAVRDWYVGAGLIAGYDSNPEARVRAKSSSFAGADLGAGYALILDPNDPSEGSSTEFNFAYQMVGAIYQGTTDKANVDQQTLSADVRHGIFGDQIFLGGRIDDQFTMEHGTAFLNVVDITPKAEVFFLPQLSGEMEFNYAHLDYFYHVSADRDVDADRNTLTLKLHYYTLPPNRNQPIPEAPDRLTELLRQLLRGATFGYAHVWNLADSSSYKYEADRLILGLDGIQPFKTSDVSFDVEYAHETQNYPNASSESGLSLNHPNGFIRRHDHLNIITLRGNANLFTFRHNRGNLGTYLQWDMINDTSTIFIRDFNEYIVSAGITYRF